VSTTGTTTGGKPPVYAMPRRVSRTRRVEMSRIKISATLQPFYDRLASSVALGFLSVTLTCWPLYVLLHFLGCSRSYRQDASLAEVQTRLCQSVRRRRQKFGGKQVSSTPSTSPADLSANRGFKLKPFQCEFTIPSISYMHVYLGVMIKLATRL